MLARSHRLNRPEDFRAAFRTGVSSGSRLVVLHLAPAADESHAARVGFVVSSAVGNAVVRNRVKRRLRHVAAELLAVLPAGTRLVIRARPAAAEADHHELTQAVNRTWQSVSAKLHRQTTAAR